MTAIRFHTADGLSLVGELRLPDGPVRGTAVLCHPHPEHGGSKDHPILWAVRNDLAANRGLAVLAFNFRGVMGSEGTFAGGLEELRDVAAAVERAREEADGPTVLVGWSFGAHVALRHALADQRVAAAALIGMPLGEAGIALPTLPSRQELGGLAAPVLLVSGAADPISPVPDVRALAARIRGAEVLVVPDTDHFFWRRERELARAVGGFVDRALA